ncbi:MAG: Flp pilus assembly complex ATPase component TadA [Desulfobulbaceae bacterium]|uniref:Flp pilus assembly complex ATPase component TadA n=1 Tax=Candidatus Desulfobia pelagia TaxID=2841692 RepID=A0A8J6NBY6_9BACT|nr:Flp pilus assembly complex ATPase component TadA [Candidatus Desulfobia pelagia]
MIDYTSFFTGQPAEEEPQQESPQQYRLLLVDDEVNILRSLQRIFRRENYHISTATSAQEALDLLSKESFHLIITDHMMPGMSGAELLQRVREKYPDTIRIMLTGHADTAAVMGAIREGAVYRFILKPAQEDDLRVSVALALEQHDIIQKNKVLLDRNTKQSKEIGALSKLAFCCHSQLPTLLHQHGLLNSKQVQELYRIQQQKKISMLKILLAKEWVDEKKIRAILRKEIMIDEVALPEFQVDPRATELIPRNFCKQQLVIPLKFQGKRRLLLAVADPTDREMLENMRFITGLQVETVLADLKSIEDKINAVYGAEQEMVSFKDLETVISTVDPLDSIEVVIEEDEDISLTELLRATEEPPAIRLINAIIIEAVRHNASDIHIQPRTKSIVVRYRIDGILSDKIQIPHDLLKPLVSRIKIMSELDIAERRKPQDGRITVKTPMKIIDMRISTMPTVNGEKVVMRILDRSASIHTVDELGFSESNLAKVLDLVDTPQGIVLATGPTGSGKTTTLYSLLQHNITAQKNYVTLEDPVEYYLDSASQVHIREKIGLDFATVLRTILRQDPDVILLGEIRDSETAEVAFHAALTGHQVFSTLHTNSAIETLSRLVDLGLRSYIIATALKGVISQRLVRKICTHCREQVDADSVIVPRLGPLFNHDKLHFYRGRGCTKCNNSGYKGRYPIHEVFIVTEKIMDLLSQNRGIVEVQRAAAEDNSISLAEDASQKVHQGLTTAAEVLRVLGPQTKR